MASLPTIKIFNGTKSMNVNERDLEHWQSKGWSTTPPVVETAPPPVDPVPPQPKGKK